MPRRRDRHAVILAVLIAGMMPLPSIAAEPVPIAFAPSGTVRLGSGVTAHYEWHGFESALEDLVRSGDALIARNHAGDLLRFDPATLRLTRVSSGEVAATCLVRGEDGIVFAGFADGGIRRVDPTTLAVNEIGRASGKLQWAAVVPGAAGQPAKPRVITVVEGKKWKTDEEGKRHEMPCSFVWDLDLGKSYEPEEMEWGPETFMANTFLLDRKYRLWIAANHDEWGSWCSYVDLNAGKVHPLPGPYKFGPDWPAEWYGVEGFIELRDGQVWAYGGIVHMEHGEGFITRLDTGKPVELYRHDNRLHRQQMEEGRRQAAARPREAKVEARREPPPADRPHDPITWITEDSGTGTLLVFSFKDVYGTDARLSRWEKMHKLKVDDGWPRFDTPCPYPYPTMRSVVPIEQRGRPMELILATPFEGLIRFAGGRETGTGPLGARSIERIAAYAEGILAFDEAARNAIWRYRDGAWSRISFDPPERPDPARPVPQGIPVGAVPPSVCVLVDRDGSIVTVGAAVEGRKGTRTTARWRDGKAEIVRREVSTLRPTGSFLTPDGQLWNVDKHTVRRFVDGRWVEVGTPDWIGDEAQLAAVNDSGPPWVLHDQVHEMLLRLSYGPGFKDPRLALLPLTTADQPVPPRIRDAIPWSKGKLLLATDGGLRTFAVAGDEVATPRLETGGRSISRLARDGRGRLWLGGEGLAVLDADGKTLHPLDALPMLGRSKIEALAADPAHPDGVMAATKGRGVVFVRVEGR